MNLAESVELAKINPKIFSIGINTHLQPGSWGNEYGWQVYCPNMWFTLGDRKEATIENCIFHHQIIMLHELTHHLSGILHHCDDNEDPEAWDKFLCEIHFSLSMEAED